jgi:hypothetical protein
LYTSCKDNDPYGLNPFRQDSCSIGQYFRNAADHFVGVIPHIDDRIGASFFRMLYHLLEGFFPGFLTELCIDGDLAPEKGLKPACNISKDTPGADSDSPYNSQAPGYPVTIEFDIGRYHGLIYHNNIFLKVEKSFVACLLLKNYLCGNLKIHVAVTSPEEGSTGG